MATSNSANDLMRLVTLSTTISFDEVAMLAHQIKAFYDRPINIVNVGKFEMPLTMVDNTVLMALPKEDRMDDIKPIKTTQDYRGWELSV